MMKKVLIILVFMPVLAFSQSKDTVEVYEGNGAFEHRIIDLSYRNLTDVPARAVNNEMEVLILDNNNIKVLPDWIANLPKLRTLSVRNNNLKDVNILMYCSNLEELYLSGNKNLADLPSFTRNNKLRVVDVVDTKINELPVRIRGMESIGYFKYSVKKNESKQ
jgi:Leucine-rich repeat (LRR) protein